MIVMQSVSCRQWHNITKLFWFTIEEYLSYLLPKFEDLVSTSLGYPTEMCHCNRRLLNPHFVQICSQSGPGILMQEHALSLLCLSSVVCGRHTFCWRCECSRWPSPSPPPPRKEGKLSTNELPPLLLSSLLFFLSLLPSGGVAPNGFASSFFCAVNGTFASVYCRC